MSLQRDSNGHTAPVPKASTTGTLKSGLTLWKEEQLRLAITAAGVALWSWNVDTNHFTMDQRAFDLWGVPLSDYVTFDELSSHIHPADRDRVRAAFDATRAIVGPYEIEFRILVEDEVRWVLAVKGTMQALSAASCTEFSLM